MQGSCDLQVDKCEDNKYVIISFQFSVECVSREATLSPPDNARLGGF